MAARNMMVVGDRLTFWREDGSKAGEVFIDEGPTPDVVVLRTIHTDGTLNTALSINTQTGVVSFPEGTTLSGEAAIAPLTDSTGGTANNTVAAMPTLTDTPASADALRDDIMANMVPVINSNFADLTAKVNALLTALGIPAA